MKIFCVGMNYPQHNIELKDTLLKVDDPVIFLKADSSLQKNGKPFFIPDDLGRIDYEAEVVVRVCKLGKTVLVVTHEKELVDQFGKRVIMIDKGEVVSDQTGGYYTYEESAE